VKYELVTAGSQYAIRRYSTFLCTKGKKDERYFDFKHKYWWGKSSNYFEDCWTKERSVAVEWFLKFTS